MVKRMLIDATHPEETRVVVVNGTRLEELDVETSTKKQLKGNIYLAKIVRVEPSLQAAFVEYGGNRHGFLAFSEIHPDYFQIPVADRQALLAAQNADSYRETHEPAEAEAPEHHPEGGEGGEAGEPAPHGDDGPPHEPPARVETIGGDEASEQELERRRARLLRNYKIQEVIKRRQIMLVQVVKEERGNKGAALTTYLSLAGRYCVLMPNTARGGGVSRKIINATDRKRLKSIAQELEIPEGMAVIIRTAGSERSKTEIKRDYEYLLRMWDNVRELTLKSSAAALVYEEASLIKRSIRDLYSRDIDEVLVDGDEGYRLAKDYMRMLTPSHAKKVQPFKDVMPMFHRYQVESQLDAMHSPVVQLRSGGYIVIGQTEALVAIDVNSGRATKERHIEETALKTNLEAADEVARQLRLRDLAGLIVIDFIDMEESRNNHSVERRLKEALKNDRARIQVGRISAFGLLELSRQRLRPSLQETTFTPCPHCSGTGLVRSVESAAMHVLRAIEEEGIRHRSSEIVVTVAPAIALYILNQKRHALAAIEERYQFHVLLAADDSLIAPAYRVDRTKTDMRPEDARAAPVAMIAEPAVAEEDEAEIEEDEAESEAEAEATAGSPAESHGDADNSDEANRKRRRRRRRKRRGDGPSQVDLATGEPMAAEENAGESEGEGEGEEEEGDDDEAKADASADGSEESHAKKRRRGRRGGRRRHRGDGPVVEGADIPEVLTHDAVADVFEAAEAAAEAEAEARAAGRGAAEPAEPAEAAEPAEEAANAEEKPKRKRAPRKKPADDEEKPKRKRAAPRKKAVEAEAEVAPADEPPPEPEPAPEPVMSPEAEAAPEAESAPEPESGPEAESEPEAEAAPEPEAGPEVEAGPEAEAGPEPEPEPEEPPAPASPPRRGWWNRLTS